jgi:hypothetical protein
MATNRLRSRPGSTICFSASESNVTFDQAFRCPAFGTDALSALAFRAWLLTSHGVEGDGVPEGRVWERAVLEQLIVPGLSDHQRAGFTTLFGITSYSGCRHEFDAASRGWAGRVMAECKALSAGVSKNDVAIFDTKTFDHYAVEIPRASGESWWRLLVSASPVADGVRRLCATKSIIVIEPGRLPWPVLCWLAGRPMADTRLAEPLLREALRLGPRACASMQQRWVHDGCGGLRYDLTWWRQDDLDFVQDELGHDWLDLLDIEVPGWLESRAEPLVARMRRASRLARTG